LYIKNIFFLYFSNIDDAYFNIILLFKISLTSELFTIFLNKILLISLSKAQGDKNENKNKYSKFYVDENTSTFKKFKTLHALYFFFLTNVLDALINIFLNIFFESTFF
jgi:hypothetical protein